MTTASTITRKSLLYRSKVEYGGWTVNHVLGCSHGCRYPCYAMSLAKRTGRVSDYDDWIQPRLVGNALELLEDELVRHAGTIDTVHLCFTTDPFMYDCAAEGPIERVASMSMSIIRRLNAEGIPVTTLTKGVYPDSLVSSLPDLHPDNQYGISLVSLSDSFQARWEPGAASARARLASLDQLASRGARTWISAEPYPTPNIDETAPNVIELLESARFADKIVFGKWNYNRLATTYDREHAFYDGIAPQVIAWCRDQDKQLHVKRGTPGSDPTGAGLFGARKVGLTRASS